MRKDMRMIHLAIGVALLYSIGIPLQALESSGTQKMEGTVTSGEENARHVEIAASDFKFTPAEFTVPAGTKVTVTLTNKAHKPHNIEFELSGKKVKLPRDIGYNESGSLEFIAPGPGTYSFTCPVDLHRTLGMKGKMIVTE